jgi:hypothetical protein
MAMRRIVDGTRSLALALLLAGAPAAAQTPIPRPAEVLGFEVGAEGRLAGWDRVVRYFEALDAASPRVRAEVVGRTTEGRPFLRVILTSEANMSRLDEIRRDNLRLADPRGLTEAEAAALVERGKVVIGHFHGLHSTEVAATLTAMQLAHELATGQDPATLQALEKTVVVMLPNHNPDGLDLVVDWHGRTAGTTWQGTAPPALYHRYTGHDNNRDWYMFTQQETRLTVEHVYRPWAPQIVHDLHQMGARGPRLFLPPYLDPWEPNVDPALQAALSGLGTHMASRLTDEGRAGVVTQALFDAWTPARAFPHTHGGVRVLSETASAALAYPLTLLPKDLEPGRNFLPRDRTWNQPLPWPGGTWRLRDAIDYQLAASRALLEHAARERRVWLQRFLEVNRRATRRTEPAAFVLGGPADDPLSLATLIDALRWGGVEVSRATAAFEADGQRFSSGSYVVPLQQPASAFAKTVLERQDYPDLRAADGTPLKPYDVTAHTLPLLMGVEARAVGALPDVRLAPVAGPSPPVEPGTVKGRGRGLAWPHTLSGTKAALRLLQEGVDVRWAKTAFREGGREWPAGTFVAPSAARSRLTALARELGLHVHGVTPPQALLRLRTPRVGLYQSFVPAMDEGWTRFVFEKQLGVPYTTLRDGDVRAGGLAQRFDAIVVPDQGHEQIVKGHVAGSMPPEYTGGLGGEGVQALRDFVQAGGTLVTLNEASRFALRELGLPVDDRLAEVDGDALPSEEPDATATAAPEAPKVYCPGAILLGRAALENPLAHGVDESLPLWFESSPAFDVRPGARAVVSYASEDPLLSGWLLGGERLAGAAALVEAPVGRGRVVLFGFRPQYRAQSLVSYVPFLNALLLAAAR